MRTSNTEYEKKKLSSRSKTDASISAKNDVKISETAGGFKGLPMPHIMDNGIVTGNIENKYDAKNPVARRLMSGFMRCVRELIEPLRDDIDSIVEVGCGEGDLAVRLASMSIADEIRACDFSDRIIGLAKQRHTSSPVRFYVRNVYDLNETDRADLVVCCEVLEHLQRPTEALDRIKQITAKYCVLSVPNEPLWRILNMLRGKYLGHFGNTPGHVNHWNKKAFIRLIGDYFDIVQQKKPLPWLMVLCKRKV